MAHETEAPTATTDVEIDAPVDHVWTSLVDDADLWLGVGSQLDDEVGGDVHVNDIVTGTTRGGIVRHIDSGRRLEFDWWPVDAPDDTSTVTIELEPLETGTRVLITETAATATPWRGAMVCSALSSVRV